MNKEEILNSKFIVMDATDVMCIGGFGNDKGNLDLLKYSEKEICELMMENNNQEDNIRLVNSLLKTIRNQNEIRQKAIGYIKSNEYYYEDDDCYGWDCCVDGYKVIKILESSSDSNE